MEKITPSEKFFSKKGPLLEASKWLSLEVLLTTSEMEILLDHLSPSELFILSKPLEKTDSPLVPLQDFLEVYKNYEARLQEKASLLTKQERLFFSSGLSRERAAFFIQDIKDSPLTLLRIKKPIIQLRAHAFHFSQEERKIYAEVCGKDSLLWGIQFSFPQLFKDEEGEVVQSLKAIDNPNTILFKTLQKWVREFTIPLKIKDKEGFIQTSLRIGREAFNKKLGEALLIQKGYGEYAN